MRPTAFDGDKIPNRHLTPAAEPVIAAAAKQQENHKNDQEKFHSVLHCVNCRTAKYTWVWSNAGYSLGNYLDTNHAANPSRFLMSV